MGNQNKKVILNQEGLQGMCKYIVGSLKMPSYQSYAKQINSISSDIPTLFESIKILHYIFKNQSHIQGQVCLRAFEIVKVLLQSCQIPCIHLLEVYILPYFYVSARRVLDGKQIQKQHSYAYACYQTIIQWALIKPKRLYQNQQMQQKSLLYDCMKNLAILAIDDQKIKENGSQDYFDNFIKTDKKSFITRLQLTNPDQIVHKVDKYRMKLMQNLSKYGNYEVCKFAQDYSTYSIQLLKAQTRTNIKNCQQNIGIETNLQSLVQATNFPIISLPSPDISILFQALDPVLTYPLNQTIFTILQNQNMQNFDFRLMKDMLKILSTLIICGDLEAYLNVIYSQRLQYLASRICEVNGNQTIQNGKYIFPQLKNSEHKVQFYIQFLLFLQYFSICSFPEIDKEQSTIRIREIEEKLQRSNFIFPKISSQKIKTLFYHNSKANAERNRIFFSKIQEMNIKESIKMNSKSIQGKNNNKFHQVHRNINSLASSLTLVAVLQGELNELIANIQSQYILIKKKNLSPSKTKSDWLSLKKKLQILYNQLCLNKHEKDPYIHQYLSPTTQKGTKIHKKIWNELKQAQSQWEKYQKDKSNVILEATSYNIEQSEIKGFDSKDNKQWKQQQTVTVDQLSDVVLLTQSRQCLREKKDDQRQEEFVKNQKKTDGKQREKNERRNGKEQQQKKIEKCKIQNIQSVTSEYGLVQMAVQSQVQSPSIKCNRFSIESNKQSLFSKNRIDVAQKRISTPKSSQNNLQQMLRQIKVHNTQNEQLNKANYIKSPIQKDEEDEKTKVITQCSPAMQKRRAISRTERFIDCIRAGSEQGNVEIAVQYLKSRQNSKSRLKSKCRSNSQRCNTLAFPSNQVRQRSNSREQCQTKFSPQSENGNEKQNRRKLSNIFEYEKNKQVKPSDQYGTAGHRKHEHDRRHMMDVVSKEYCKSSSRSKYIKLGHKGGWDHAAFRKQMIAKCYRPENRIR